MKECATCIACIRSRKFLLITASAVIQIVAAVLLSDASAGAMTVTDMARRKVVVPTPVRRLVALGPGALRFVVYLGAFDRVVGVEEAERGRYPLAARPYGLAVRDRIGSLPVIGEGGAGRSASPEAVMMAKPDVILVVGMDTAEVNRLQTKTGIPVVVMNYGGIGVFRKEALASLMHLGRLLGREQRASDIVRFIESCRSDLTRRTMNNPSARKQRVYVGGIGYKGRQGITSTEAGFLPLAFVGGRNLADDAGRSGHLFIDREQLLAWNPDVLFIDANGLDIVTEDYAQRPEYYQALRAVKDGRAFSLLPYNYYNTNIETALADAYYMGKILHPGTFRDIDPAGKADEIFRFFVGKAAYATMKEAYGGFGRLVFDRGRIHVR